MMTAPTLDTVHKNPASVSGLSTQILTAMLMACTAVSTTLMTALLTSGSVRAETTIDDPQRLLRAAEVAEMLGTTTGVVYEMTRRGKIGHVGTGIVGGRGVRFTRQQVAAFIKSREISPLIRARVRAMCVPARMGRKNTDGSYPENRSALRQSCLAG
jgi:excisionase family DNA binding protein